jgi:hypothetical protein
MTLNFQMGVYTATAPFTTFGISLRLVLNVLLPTRVQLQPVLYPDLVGRLWLRLADGS